MTTLKDLSGEYAPAYTISNEDQHWATAAVPGVKRVLTVAGSGDQALFYRLNGATHIDTFDRTYNAGAIQDVKFAAIKTLSPLEYFGLLIDLFSYRDFITTPHFQKIMPLLSPTTIKLINMPNNRYMFSNGSAADCYPENIPTDKEYAKLRETLTKPFNFIQSDLGEISAKISGTYDLINISNIFDYCYNGKTQGQILYSLAQHLNVGGHIVYLPQMPKCSYDGVRISTPDCTLEYEKTLQNEKSKMILFQRTR